MKRLTPLLALLALTTALAGGALAQSSAAPSNSAKPQISGTEKAGSKLTTSNGTWSNSPTSFAYQWRRCATDGTACGDIVGATSQSYTLTSSDVHHTVRVVVTAKNADGAASATSDPTGVIGSANGPSNTVRPAVSGTAQIGGELTVSNGSWSPSATSFGYQWQRCAADGTNCLNIAGATGKTYGIRTVDAGNRLRALVTAHDANGQTTVATAPSDLVAGTTTTTVTTTVNGNQAPRLGFISLHRVGIRVYARFRVCDDTAGMAKVIERDNKARVISYTRRFTTFRGLSCGTFSRHWIPAARFRTAGRYVVTLRAIDRSGALSLLKSRSLFRR